MVSSNDILFIIYVIGAYTLFYTYQNNFSVFLLTLLLMLSALWCYLHINERVDYWENKINNVKTSIENKVDFFVNKLPNIKDLTQDKLKFFGEFKN